jgi:hypothetical protein
MIAAGDFMELNTEEISDEGYKGPRRWRASPACPVPMNEPSRKTEATKGSLEICVQKPDGQDAVRGGKLLKYA